LRKSVENMKNIIWLQAFMVAALLACTGTTSADTTIYDKNYNVQGHKKESGGTTKVYDKNWNRIGYEKGDKIYDKNWNVKGYKKSDDHNKGPGYGQKSKGR